VDVVLNWLTQGVIVAILAAVALRLIPPSRAQARYGALWTAYLLVLMLPTVPIALTIASGGAPVDLVPAAVGPVVTMPTTWWTSAAVAAGLWTAWCCIHAMRLAVSALGVRNARRRARECPSSVLARLPHWSRVSMADRQARVILSDRVRVAAVLGCGTPTIALAPALIDQLDVKDLDRVLVHEWAHVQRRDDLAQLAQRFLGIAIGWHPAAWWLERQLDSEREAACDEIAVSVTGSAKGYATCLALLAARPEFRLASVGELAAASPARLRSRIMRILALADDARPRPWRAMTVGVSSGLLACSLVVADLELVRSAVTSAVATTALSAPRSEPIVMRLAVASEAPARKEPARRTVTTRHREIRANQTPPAQEVSRLVDTTEAVSEPQASAEAFEPLPSSALSVHSTASLVALPVESGRLAQTADERSSWMRAADVGAEVGRVSRDAGTGTADVGVEIGRASRDAGTATADMFRRFSMKLASSF
jgi:bla regulator protein blaR1